MHPTVAFGVNVEAILVFIPQHANMDQNILFFITCILIAAVYSIVEMMTAE